MVCFCFAGEMEGRTTVVGEDDDGDDNADGCDCNRSDCWKISSRKVDDDCPDDVDGDVVETDDDDTATSSSSITMFSEDVFDVDDDDGTDDVVSDDDDVDGGIDEDNDGLTDDDNDGAFPHPTKDSKDRFETSLRSISCSL